MRLSHLYSKVNYQSPGQPATCKKPVVAGLYAAAKIKPIGNGEAVQDENENPVKQAHVDSSFKCDRSLWQESILVESLALDVDCGAWSGSVVLGEASGL